MAVTRKHPIPAPGTEFGLWTVADDEPRVVGKLLSVRVVCACGAEAWIAPVYLWTYHTSRCPNCPKPRTNARFPRTKGETRRLRQAVLGAIGRCTEDDNPHYDNYGGRGIRVHAEWIERPELFVAYLLTLEGWWVHGLFFDRIDNDGHYEPGNLRFVDAVESARNRRVRYDSIIGNAVKQLESLRHLERGSEAPVSDAAPDRG
jgi:hypothetical protein